MVMGIGGAGGMDIDMMIAQAMEAEEEPIMNQYEQTEEMNQQIQAYQNINSSLDTFKKDVSSIGADTFSPVAESSNEDIVTANADSDADAASYDVEVDQLAKNQRIVSSSAARTIDDEDISELGGGEFRLSTEDDVGFGVYLDNEIEDLSDIASAINDAEENDGLVQASVIEDNLVLEAGDSDTELAIQDMDDIHDGKGVLENLGIESEDGDNIERYNSRIEIDNFDGLENEETFEFDIGGESEVTIGEEDTVEDFLTALEGEIADDNTVVEMTEDDDIVITSDEEITAEGENNTDIDGITDIADETIEDTVLSSEDLEEYDEDNKDNILLQGAQEAIAEVNGIEITSDSNQIEDAVDGVDLDLHQESDETVSIDVDTDTEKIREEIEGFVESYNSVIDLIDLYTDPQQTAEEEGEEGEEEGAAEVVEGGILQGESALRTLQSQLHDSVVAPVENVGEDGEEATLSQFGIQVQRDGRLEIDEPGRGWGQDLDDAIENDLDELQEVFTRESEDYIEVDDAGDISDDLLNDDNEFSLEVGDDEQTVSLEEDNTSLDDLIEAINDDEDGMSGVIANEEDGNLDFSSFSTLNHEELEEQEPGIIDRAETAVESAVGSQFGTLPGYIGEPGADQGRIARLENEIEMTNESIERDIDRLEDREDRLRDQFTRMQQSITEMQAQQQQLASQIGTMGM